jgi:hypothetical protein
LGEELKMSKKGISVWISWVILVAFTVMVGSFVLQWSRNNASVTVEDIKEKGEILTMCQETGVSVSGYCQKAQTLNINVTNNNNRKVDALIVRASDIYNMPQSAQKNVSLSPEESKGVSIVKQGMLKEAELMPIIIIGKKRVICQSRKVLLQNIGFC